MDLWWLDGSRCLKGAVVVLGGSKGSLGGISDEFSGRSWMWRHGGNWDTIHWL